MKSLHLAGEFIEVPGTHNWALWRAMIPQALTVASEHMTSPSTPYR